jgi:hypothetical protein
VGIGFRGLMRFARLLRESLFLFLSVSFSVFLLAWLSFLERGQMLMTTCVGNGTGSTAKSDIIRPSFSRIRWVVG